MTSFPRESAQIYEFPDKRRAPSSIARDPATGAADVIAARYPKAVFGSGWYHEAAIRDAEDDPKQ